MVLCVGIPYTQHAFYRSIMLSQMKSMSDFLLEYFSSFNMLVDHLGILVNCRFILTRLGWSWDYAPPPPRPPLYFMATPAACSQEVPSLGAGRWAPAADLCHSHSNTGSEPHLTYTTARGNAGSLTHCERPGIKPTSSWILVGFLTHWAAMRTLRLCISNRCPKIPELGCR